MVNQNTSNPKVSLLEKIVVNWITIPEGLFIWPLNTFGLKAAPKFQEYFDKYGVFKGIWKLKITDYQRLLSHAHEEGNIPENVLKVYDKTPCGCVMKLTYRALR